MEIIEIELTELTELTDGRWAWRATQVRRHGTDRLGLDGLARGDRLVVEVRSHGLSWTVQRVLRKPAHARPAATRPRACSPRSTLPRATAPVAGDVLLRRVRFSSDNGEDRASKLRPCVVVEVAGHEMRVRPIHGSNSFIRREGMGRRLLDWAAAGLRKPSVVSATDLWVPVSGPHPIGRLGDTDRRRILPDAGTRPASAVTAAA